MTRRRGTAVATALLLAALATAGCGLGPGGGIGSVRLTVTRDFGAVPMLERTLRADESDTVMRLLEGATEISTRYGGGYVRSIEGVAEAQRGGHPYDWFYYTDGIEAPIGAAESAVRQGERVWWDYRDWSATLHVPAVVGSFPAPFAHGYEGRERPTELECEGGGGACEKVRAALKAVGADLSTAPGAIRVLVGAWARIRSDPAAAQLERGPQVSGIFATFERRGGGYELRALDENGAPARRFGPGAGLVAATRRYEEPPVWIVTGATGTAVQRAADLLSPANLRDHYAVVGEGGKQTPLPAPAR
ncbi:MAG TPA: DUF4430 domain-containing protein [Solirubrobacterales bacterium]|nr:DUF4430 domain-containing protein [Solirubrobacterales bacterium]